MPTVLEISTFFGETGNKTADSVQDAVHHRLIRSRSSWRYRGISRWARPDELREEGNERQHFFPEILLGHSHTHGKRR